MLEFKQCIVDGEVLDKVLLEVFVVCCEVGCCVLGMCYYDVQLIGGMVFYLGKIVEMCIGEGKILVVILLVYFNVLEGKGVYVVIVNDYLVCCDVVQMGKLYNWLGLSVGVVYLGMLYSDKCEVYVVDIIYGINNEFGFDYLCDNMVLFKVDCYQCGLYYVIVDEVDFILIDEVCILLIIFGLVDDFLELYICVNCVVLYLVKQEVEDGEGDFWVDEKGKQVYLFEVGMEYVEQLLVEVGIFDGEIEGLYVVQNLIVVYYFNVVLCVYVIYQCDVDYIVCDGEVVIVDEFIGCILVGCCWFDGLYQVVEVKEGVLVQCENQMLVSIIFQNLFCMYKKLFGMIGMVDIEVFEFQSIYGLEVVVILINCLIICKDSLDQVFFNCKGKFNVVLVDIEECVKCGQLVLVGIILIEILEMLFEYLSKVGVKYEVFNVKQYDCEVIIVVNVGCLVVVIIVINMVGCGIDIVLGGLLEVEIYVLGEDVIDEQKVVVKVEWQKCYDVVKVVGGLYIVGIECYELCCIDNQLCGCLGCQGDLGLFCFYLLLEDNLMCIFVFDWVQKVMCMMGMKEDDVIEDCLVSCQIEKVQCKVEVYNFDICKNLLDFDDVNNDQCKVIYVQCDELLDVELVKVNVDGICDDVIFDIVVCFVLLNLIDEQWDLCGLEVILQLDFGLQMLLIDLVKQYEELDVEVIVSKVQECVNQYFVEKEVSLGEEIMCVLEKYVMLIVLDQSWKEYLVCMDYLCQGIYLCGYVQKQFKQEYKKEVFELFLDMLENVKCEVVILLVCVCICSDEEVQVLEVVECQQVQVCLSQLQFQYQDVGGYSVDEEVVQVEVVQQGVVMLQCDELKIGCNDLCLCGSGKKYKYCYGQLS